MSRICARRLHLLAGHHVKVPDRCLLVVFYTLLAYLLSVYDIPSAAFSIGSWIHLLFLLSFSYYMFFPLLLMSRMRYQFAGLLAINPRHFHDRFLASCNQCILFFPIYNYSLAVLRRIPGVLKSYWQVFVTDASRLSRGMSSVCSCCGVCRWLLLFAFGKFYLQSAISGFVLCDLVDLVFT